MNAPETSRPPADAVAVASLPVTAIVASLSNPRKRFDEAYIAELADSMVGLDAEALREPKVQPKTAKPKPAKTASTPTHAAQAPEAKAAAAPADIAKPVLKPSAKTAKAKADPAPTTSANEPAAPAKPPKLDTWPFPTGARP